MIPDLPEIPALVVQGFALALVVWVFVWGITLPVRVLARFLGY